MNTALNTQGSMAESLGYPPDAILLVIHADDFGIADGVNGAVQAAFECGRLSSASVMMPAPRSETALEYARNHPEFDCGVHLTFTSEWPNCALGPIRSSESVPTLVNARGHFWPDVVNFGRHAAISEVECEISAQVARCLEAGVTPTHLDVHMFALYQTPELLATYIRMAEAAGIIPMVLPQDSPKVRFRLSSLPQVRFDGVFQADRNLAPEQWEQSHIRMLRNLRPGLYEWIVHPGRDGASLRSVMDADAAWGTRWRQRDLDLLLSNALGAVLKEKSIQLITWRHLSHAIFSAAQTALHAI